MSNKPCLNPNCKSHGRPHPNCRCYGGFADGGEVGNFCSSARMHETGCEYFAEGGEVEPGMSWDETVPVGKPEGGSEPAADDMSWDNTVPVEASEPGMSWDETVPTDKYESPGQQALTAMEGAAQGIAGPLAPLAEEGLSKLGIPGISPEEVAAREAVNPLIHGAAKTTALVGSMATGVGEAGLAMKAAARAAEAMKLGKIGASIVSGALSSGMLQGGDELTKMLLGQSPPEDGVAAHLMNIGGAALLGGAGATAVAGAQAAKLGTKITSFLGGLASAADPNTEMKAIDMLIKDGHVSQRAFDLGKKAFQYISAPAVAGAAGAYQGYKHEGSWGALKGAVEGAIFGGAVQHSAKTLAPAMIKIMSSAPIEANIGSIVRDVLDHANSVGSGTAKMNKAVDALFKGGSQQLWDESRKSKSRDKLQSYIDKGGMNQALTEQAQAQASVPNFAEGGEVPGLSGDIVPTPIEEMNHGVATVYPDQNILINAAKGRMSKYLTSLKPPENQPKLAFDDEPDTKRLKDSYDRATDIANHPLSVIHEIQNGTIEPEHVQHFKALYPEIDGMLQRKLTDKIIDMQMKGERPPLAIRQGLSLLMGTPLASELAPSNIMAIQSMYQQQAQAKQGEQATPSAAKTKDLSKIPQEMKTQSQSLVARSQRSK